MFMGIETEYGMTYIPVAHILMIADIRGDGCNVKYHDGTPESFTVFRSVWSAERVYQAMLEMRGTPTTRNPTARTDEATKGDSQ